MFLIFHSPTSHRKLRAYFFLIFLGGILVLTFLVFRQFLAPLLLAGVCAVIFRKFYSRIFELLRGRSSLAAFLTVLIVLLAVLTPLAVFGIQVSREITDLYRELAGAQSGGFLGLVRFLGEKLTETITAFLPAGAAPALSIDVDDALRRMLDWAVGHTGDIFSGVTQFLFHVFVFLLAFYYLLKDGRALKRAIITLSPLKDSDDEEIFRKLALAITSVIRGTLVIAITQGVLTGIGFAFFGVPRAILWGGAALVSSLIPGIGTALVLTPAILYLFFIGNVTAGIGLLVWGVCAVGLIDNFLGPKLMGRGGEVHSFLILLSIFGGLNFFGPLGFIFGPLLLSLLFALLDIYASLENGLPEEQEEA